MAMLWEDRALKQKGITNQNLLTLQIADLALLSFYQIKLLSPIFSYDF